MDRWWIDKPYLLGSSNPTDADLEQVRRDGFGVLVSLLREEEQAPRYDVARARVLGLVRHNIPVKDFGAPSVDQLEQFVKLVADLPPGAKVIVHCEGGTGRTGTFAAAHWVAKGATASEAIARIRKARPHAVETPEQEAALKDFATRRMERGRTRTDAPNEDKRPGLRNDGRRHLSQLADYVTLVYHEARNVRHLIQAHAVEPEPWKYLVALPVNRNKAWEALQDLRSEACKADTVGVVLLPFERRLRVTLEELEVLYAHPAWRNATYGGNAWKTITQLVRGLAAALAKDQPAEALRLLETLSRARHNTGSIAAKLRNLDEALRDASHSREV